MGDAPAAEAAEEMETIANKGVSTRPPASRSRKNSRVTRSQINDFQHAPPPPMQPQEDHPSSNPNEFISIASKSSNTSRYHVCRHCNRSFNSGRALGGHIRIHGSSFAASRGGATCHNQPSNSSNNSSSSKVRSRSDEDVVGAGFGVNTGEYAEEESSREMSNDPAITANKMKMVSLYTLRNNPRRSSILMDPEFSLEHASPIKRSSFESSNESGSEYNRSRPVVGTWSVTKTRSERKLRSSCSSMVVGNERVTANLLVMLAKKETTDESVFKHPNLESQGSIEDMESDDDDDDEFMVRKKPRKDFDGGGHRCDTCKKVFSSHQALGGHKASHRRGKGVSEEEEEELYYEDEEEEGEGSGGGGYGDRGVVVGLSHNSQLTSTQDVRSPESCLKAPPPQHQCSICLRVFLSGQALGGHKRCHWVSDRGGGGGGGGGGGRDATPSNTYTTASVISTVEKQESGVGGDTRLFKDADELLDLNQPPPLDDDELQGVPAPPSAQSGNIRFRAIHSFRIR